MDENGDEKLLAVARHIAKTLGRTETMTDDILQIFSAFDGRFSKMSEKGEEEAGPRDVAALEQALKSLHRRVARFAAAERPLWSDTADSAAFLDTVDELVIILRDWEPVASEKQVSDLLDRASDLLQQAMFRLEDEFRLLIERGGESFDSFNVADTAAHRSNDSDSEGEEDGRVIPVANPIPDYDFVIDALPSGTIAELHEIAKRMVPAGYGKECSHVYSSCRREFLEESISRLGLEKRSIEEVQKTPWAQLEDEIDRWVKTAKVALKILLPSERRLIERIFSGLPPSFTDLTFMEVCRGAAIQILNFADAIAIGARAPERLFGVLDLFETMRDLMPEFNSVFSDSYCCSIRAEALTIWKRLGESIRGIFMELENLIRRDPAKAAVPGGGVHPITRYVMNYLRAACGSCQTLEQVLQRAIDGEFENLDACVSAGPTTSSLSVEVSWIMELLESNLEAKSKMYRDPALSAIFLMNNNRYIVQKARDRELGTVLGEDWVRKHAAKVRQYHINYQRAAWGRLLAAIKIEGLNTSSGSGNAKVVVKERLKQFNAVFEEAYRTQKEWVVVDNQLRTELRISVAGNLIPAYRSFLGRFQNVVEGGKHSDKYVKYSLEDVELKINELFQGRK
ncbi:exocyst complex component EXO70B1-like [Aristolochia californica]|uniref:exocyst complex component EXO70B1-like n=1 Tax=Aristolochia californica TaxID=171875 RepID=UPI0035D56F04